MEKAHLGKGHDRFNTLPDVKETTTDKYNYFIKINKEVMEELIPKMEEKIPTIKGPTSANRMRSSQQSPKIVSSKARSDDKQMAYESAKRALDDA